MDRRSVALVALVTLVVSVTTACSRVFASGPDFVDVPPPTAVAPYVRAECPRDGAGLDVVVDGKTVASREGAVPAGFRAVTVIHCAWSEQPRSGVTIVERIAPVTDELLAALALPDQRINRSDIACAAKYTPPTLIILVDRGGRAVTARQPEGGCGDPRREVVAAVAALSVTSTRDVVIEQGP